jgi:hypothetical protein
MAQEMQEQEKKICTFKPQINRNSSSLARKYSQRQSAEAFTFDHRHEEDPNPCTFRPSINPNSSSLARRRSLKQNAENVTYTEDKFRDLYIDSFRKRENLKAVEQKYRDDFAFRP